MIYFEQLYNIKRIYFIYGYFLGLGRQATCFNGLLLLSYEYKENLFVDLTAQQRNYAIGGEKGKNNSSLVSVGIRFNFIRREYE